jgi:hypothetical protein
MPDIAQLGIQIDSSPVTQATAALNGLVGAAGKASTSTTALHAAAAPAGAVLGAMQKATVAASAAHAGLSTQAMAAMHSVRSMAEGFALGMPPMQVMMQQMNHLSYAASAQGGIAGAFKEAGAALGAFISPTTAVIVGVGALTVGFVATVASIAKTELAFGELSERAGASVQALHALESAAAFKGIGATDFLKGMTQFNSLTDQARNHMGALAELFRAQPGGIAAGSMTENLSKIADLIANAKTEQQKYNLLQQLGLPATREWVQFLGQGATALQQATTNASQFGNEADERLIKAAREFNEAWDTAWHNFDKLAKSAFVNAWDGINRLINGAKSFNNTLTDIATGAGIKAHEALGLAPNTFTQRFGSPGDFPTRATDPVTARGAAGAADRIAQMLGAPGPSATAKPTVDPQVLQHSMQLEMPRLGPIGTTATVAEPASTDKKQVKNDCPDMRRAA